MASGDTLKAYAIRLAVLYLALGLTCAALFLFIFPERYFHFVPFLFIYHYLRSLLVFRSLARAKALSMHKFSQRFLLLTGGKFFASILFVLLFLLIAPQHKKPFLVIYITLYFASLFQEVLSFQRLNGHKNSAAGTSY